MLRGSDHYPRVMPILKRGAIAVLLTLICACQTQQTLRVTDIQLGRSLNADSSVGTSAIAFTPHDTIYLSVLTAGKGRATISVRWSLAGRVLDEPKKQVSYSDAAATSFELQSGSGFPEGNYSVDVFLDGRPVGSRTFKVEPARR